jgi:hypothetical protein
MTDNIVQMPTPLSTLGKQLREDIAAVETFHSQWVESMLRLGAHLHEARDRFPSDDTAFGHWLVDEKVDLGPKDRAALIAMAADPNIFRMVLIEQTDVLHANTIWQKYRQRFEIHFKAPPAGTSSEIPPETAKQTGDLSDAPDPTRAQSESKDESVALSRAKPRDGGGTKWKLRKYPDADLVFAHVTRAQTRSALAKIVSAKGGRAVWELLVEAIKLGHYGPPSTGNERPNLRMILPWVPPGSFADSIEIKTQDGRKYVRDIIFPLLAQKPELKQDPSNFGKAVARRRYETEEELRKTRQMEHHASVVAKHQFQPGEQEVVAYGTPMWPLEYSLGYTYEELKHACWYANFFLNSIARRDWSVVSAGMMGRHLIKWIGPIAPGVTTAIKQIFSAYELNPKGECKFPMTPVNFGID